MIIKKQVVVEKEVIVCDICGNRSDVQGNSIERCIEYGCPKHMCAEHSEYYGGKCVYWHEDGMFCPEHSKGKVSRTKWDE